MKTIWKYELKTGGIREIQMPEGAEILHIDVQMDAVCIWAFVDPENVKTKRVFHTYGTGHNIDTDSVNLRYIGTYQLNRGFLIFHVFEQI